MTSSKTSSRKAAPTKKTTRKASDAGVAQGAAVARAKTAARGIPVAKSSARKSNNVAQATKGHIVSDLSDKTLTPPSALAAGQNPSPMVVVSTDAESEEQALSKKELIDQAVQRSGIKKKDAKPVVEALLAILGEAVAEGRDLNLKPFGKLRINRSDVRSNGTVHVCRLRQPLNSFATSEDNGESGDISDRSPLAEIAG